MRIGMKQQMPIKKIKDILTELSEISGSPYALLTGEADVVCASGAAETPAWYETDGYPALFTRGAACLGADAAWKVLPEGIFLRIRIDEESGWILFCGTGEDVPGALMAARMAASQVRGAIRGALPRETRADFLAQVISGAVSGQELLQKAQRLHLRSDELYVYVIRLSVRPDETVLKMIRSLFLPSESGYLIETDDGAAVLLKYRRAMHEDPAVYAGMIVDNLQAEAMINVWVGFERRAHRLQELSDVCRKAASALRIGMTYLNGIHVFDSDQMGLAGLIDSIPQQAAQKFLQEVLAERSFPEFSQETLNTINCLLESNLNISETARKLYIHRNTLLYRLERIEERIGIDIRSFDGAMTFKLMMLLKIHLTTGEAGAKGADNLSRNAGDENGSDIKS